MVERERKDWDQICKALTENQSVSIENAIIEVGAQMQNGAVVRDLSIRNCVIRGTFSFNFVTFGESVSFTDTIFEDGIDLTGCRIQGQFVNCGVEFRGKAEFEGMSVGGDAYFERAVFNVEPNFAMTSWGSVTRFCGTKFNRGAAFLSATFGGHLLFYGDTLVTGAEADLTFATINGIFSAVGSSFEKSLLLVSVRTDSAVLITKVEFGTEARLNLNNAQIGGELNIEDCRFLSNSICLCLDMVQVEGNCSVGVITCHGDTSMQYARFRSHLSIGDHQKPVEGETKKQSQFNGSFSLEGSKVDDNFGCANTVFKGAVRKDEKSQKVEKLPTYFTGMKVGGETHIYWCDFNHGIKFNRSQFAGVFGTNSCYGDFLECQGAQFHSSVRFFTGCTFKGGAHFYFCIFDQEANFGGAKISVQLVLTNCEFRRSLLFVDHMHKSALAQFDKDANLQLKGSTYGALEPSTDEYLKKLIGQIPNVPLQDVPLVFLEQCLRRSERQKEADMIRYHRFERLKKRLSWWSFNGLYLGFYQVSSGYGTIIWPVFIVALLTGAAVLSIQLVPLLGSDWKIVEAICGVLSTTALALWVDGVKRRLWPQ